MPTKCVLVFGTFDGLHSGHEFFLRSAKEQGTRLTVAVARDEHVMILKNKVHQYSLEKRMSALRHFSFVDDVVACDAELGSYHLLEQVRPDLIVMGHDQLHLEKSLLDWMDETGHVIPLVRVEKQLT